MAKTVEIVGSNQIPTENFWSFNCHSLQIMFYVNSISSLDKRLKYYMIIYTFIGYESITTISLCVWKTIFALQFNLSYKVFAVESILPSLDHQRDEIILHFIKINQYFKYRFLISSLICSDHGQFGGWIFFFFAQSKYYFWVHLSDMGLCPSAGSVLAALVGEPWSIWELSSEVFKWSFRRFSKVAIAFSTFGKYRFIIHILSRSILLLPAKNLQLRCRLFDRPSPMQI